jgi:hypothetical protein
VLLFLIFKNLILWLCDQTSCCSFHSLIQAGGGQHLGLSGFRLCSSLSFASSPSRFFLVEFFGCFSSSFSPSPPAPLSGISATDWSFG